MTDDDGRSSTRVERSLAPWHLTTWLASRDEEALEALAEDPEFLVSLDRLLLLAIAAGARN